MKSLLALLRSHPPTRIGTPLSCGNGVHVAQRCACFVDYGIRHDVTLDWRDCRCAGCDGFRRLRMHRMAEMLEERLYERHCAKQERRRRRMNSVDTTAWSEEMARPTVVSDELGVRTIVSVEEAV